MCWGDLKCILELWVEVAIIHLQGNTLLWHLLGYCSMDIERDDKVETSVYLFWAFRRLGTAALVHSRLTVKSCTIYFVILSLLECNSWVGQSSNHTMLPTLNLYSDEQFDCTITNCIPINEEWGFCMWTLGVRKHTASRILRPCSFVQWILFTELMLCCVRKLPGLAGSYEMSVFSEMLHVETRKTLLWNS